MTKIITRAIFCTTLCLTLQGCGLWFFTCGESNSKSWVCTKP